MIRALKCIVLGLMMVSSATQAQENTLTEQWEKAIAAYQQHDWLNADIAISKNKQALFKKQAGYADIEQKRTFKNDTLFPIASLTKQFIAVAILLLNDDKRLSLDQPLIQVLKSANPIWQKKPPSWAHEITIHQLLTHTSGLIDYLDEPISLEKVRTEDILPAIVSQIKDKPLLNPPGEQFHYSNTGYLLLYAIIQTLSPQKDVDKFLQQRLFQRLKMTHTFMPTPAEEIEMYKQLSQNRYYPTRYVANLSDLTKNPTKVTKLRTHIPYSGGAGMVSTLDDLMKWNDALYQGRVLSSRAFKLFTTEHVKDSDPQFGGEFKYGYGIFIIDDNPNNIIYSHGGWLEGIRTQMSYGKDSKLSVVLLSNLSPDESQAKDKIDQQVHSLTKLANEMQFIGAT